MKLTGRRALVTGSTSGIGLGIASALAEAGADVMLNGFGDAGAIDATCRELAERTGVRVAYVPGDVSRYEDVEAMVRATESTLGSLDLLINNAGIQHTAPVDSFPLDRWQAVVGINLTGVFHGIRAALPGMKARGFGRIVNIASAHGLVASVEKAAYVAAKHGVIGLTKVVALETATLDITCNAVCPGWVRTTLVERQIEARAERDGVSVDAAARALVGEKQPSQRFATTAEIAAAVVYLCSPLARSVTGIALPVDGGWTAQ